MTRHHWCIAEIFRLLFLMLSFWMVGIGVGHLPQMNNPKAWGCIGLGVGGIVASLAAWWSFRSAYTMVIIDKSMRAKQ